MKTRTYLILMAAAILVPVIAFSWIGLNMLLQKERESRIRSIHESAHAIALTIDREIATAQASLRVLSHSRFLKEMDTKALHEMMSVSSRTADSWALLSDAQGRPVVNTLLPFGTPLPKEGRKWAAKVLSEKKPVVSDYFIGTLVQKPTISVDVPVFSATGANYILSQRFLAEHFNKVFRLNDLPASWIVAIFGSDGVTLARSKGTEEFVGKPVRGEIYEASRKNFSGLVVHPSRENIPIYDVYTHTNLTGWTVAVGVPTEEIEAPARHAALYAALALAAIFALAGMVVTFLARRLANSLELAAGAAKSLGQDGIPKLQSSKVHEVDVLQSALYEVGVALSNESASLRRLEEEREQLLLGEHEARRQAEAQNRAKDDILAMLGHELRNPLAAISGAFLIMEAPNASPEQLERARAIGKRQVNHLARIVDDLLDIGRIMAGKILLRKQPIELSEYVRHCIDAQCAADPASHVWKVQTLILRVQADSTLLEQIFGIVLGNAVKYTPKGGTIEIQVLPDGEDAVITVQDNGIGMSPDLLPRIFEIFVQGPTTIDRAHGGLGLGLSLVKQLLALHGGTVAAASPGAGKGSTFTLRLPQHFIAAPEAQPDTVIQS